MVKMLKLRSTIQGSAPAGANFRFQLAYESEELRKKWVASDVHQKVWPTIENTMRSKDYTVLPQQRISHSSRSVCEEWVILRISF